MNWYPSLAETIGNVAAFCLCLAITGGLLYQIHYWLTAPLRRAEQARLFLDLIEDALNRGQAIEEMIVSLSRSGEPSVGARFHSLAAFLEKGHGLGDALARVPRLLPPQITAMLKTGMQIGDVRKILPACRQLLKDGVSQTHSAVNYLVVITCVITPAVVATFIYTAVRVIPLFREIAAAMSETEPAGIALLYEYRVALILIQVFLLFALWSAAFTYIIGPRVVSWFPFLGWFHYRLPWRRKRMQRDFSTMLAILLDSGVSEPEAVHLAAECTANKSFQRRARRAVAGLQRGLVLTEAIQAMDDTGEFNWRLTNACHTRAGFLQSLAGWHESLDAKAFQQEQAAAHAITTGLVILNGVFVAVIASSVFLFLTAILNTAALW